MTLIASYSDQDKTVTIQISGRFDFTSVHREFRQSYKGRAGGIRYVVDLKETEFMDSSALGMLLLLREHAVDAGTNVRIINCGPEIKQILAIANFSKLFEIT